MTKDGVTSQRGYAAALVLSAAGGAVLGRIGSAAGSAAWLCCIAGGIAGVVFFQIVGGLAAVRESDGFFETLRYCFGSPLGRIVSMVMALFALRLCAHEAALTGEFISTTLLDSTSTQLVSGMLLILCAFAAASGECAVSNWAEIMMPPVIVMLALALLLAAPDMSFEELAPGGVSPGEALNIAAEFFLSSFCGGLGCVVFLFRVGKDRKKRWPGAVAIGGATVVMALLYIWNTAFLGANMPARFNFPTYHALRVIGLSSLEVRLEALLMLPIVFMSFLRAAVLLLMARRGIEDSLRLGPRKFTPYLLAAAAFALAWGLYRNQSVIAAREHELRVLTFFIFVVPVTAALISGLIRRKLARREAVREEGEG